MRRAFPIAIVAALLASSSAQARDITVIEFLGRFISDPATAFKDGPPPKRKLKPAYVPLLAVPLLAVPLPHLRPGKTDNTTLGYQTDETPAVVATDDMPMPRLRPADLLSTLAAPEDANVSVADTTSSNAVTTAILDAAARARAKPATTATLDPSASSRPVARAELPIVIPPPTQPSSAAMLASLTPVPLPSLRPPPTDLVRSPPVAGSTCGVAIAQLGVIATPLAPIEEGECGIDMPVAVSGLDGGRINVNPKAIIDCHLAERLATWVKDTVQPSVRKDFGGELTGLRVAASYACRNRDSLPDAKLSEHAHGNAIDIAAFRVGDRWIEVKPGWNGGGEDAAFLVDTRKSACGPFTTVLGPGSDSFHTDHFHLDMIERGTAGPSRGLYCK